MNTDILSLLQPIMAKFSIGQRTLATQILSDPKYTLGVSAKGLVIRDLDGKVYPFYEFVRAKCNCN